MDCTIRTGALIVGALLLASLQGRASAQEPSGSVDGREDLAQAYVTCSLVWDVASSIAIRAKQPDEVPFFRERAEESRLAAVATAPQLAASMLAQQRRDLLPDMRMMAETDAAAFMNGPYRSCAGIAAQAAMAAARAGKTGSDAVIIQ